MRRGLSLLLLLVTACATSDEPGYGSVRERLSDGPTRLPLTIPASTGELTVRWRSLQDWQTSRIDLEVTGGDLDLSVADDGALAIDRLDLMLAPLSLAIEDRDIQVVDIRASLFHPVRADTRWADDNAAEASVTIGVRVDWSLAIDGEVSPLGDLIPPPMLLVIELGGDASHVDATLGLDSPGLLWSWLDLIELRDLSLTLAATTGS